MGDYGESNYGADHSKCYDDLVKFLYKEFGVFKLVDGYPENSREEFANARFQEAGVGYQYVSGDVIRVDSEIVHKEVILPVLVLLHNPTFASAEKEYLEGHEAYRHGRFEDCIVSCGKAFESVLKVTGAKRGC
jgi:uncharacterized protein DUF7014